MTDVIHLFLLHFLQEGAHLLRAVASWPNLSLINNLSCLQHIQPLWNSTIFTSCGVFHFIHYDGAQGVLFDQELCCSQPLLLVSVFSNVKVVGKDPTVC